MKNQNYQLRCVRLGAANVAPQMFDMVHELQERKPLLDDEGHVVSFLILHRTKPCHELLGKFVLSDFDLGTQIENGVSLSAININRSSVRSIAEIEQIVGKLGSLEAYAAKVAQQRAEFDKLVEPLNSEING